MEPPIEHLICFSTKQLALRFSNCNELLLLSDKIIHQNQNVKTTQLIGNEKTVLESNFFENRYSLTYMVITSYFIF